ncbi:ROK family protein [Ructibacterium gallinarum]|uniref:ROK family protein n=1 Tax=Ructibacterium gallinarum TaxID=2779355 RepID=A0A9D5R8Q1_9FIRM|nr:ROK family protein [Ructibacterium gallinarum]MBE5040225.1 ROK family protein [Ructibacterium gallinarum]
MFIGIDLGGTNIAVGLVDNTPSVIAQASRPTNAKRPYQEIIRDMAELCKEVTENAGYTMADIQGIGVGSPGTIDSTNGEIVYANNLDWHHVPLVKELKTYYPDIPMAVENDANAAAYGEYIVNGDNTESFLAITLGTGVGGGIVLDKKIYRGFNGAGGEIGHFTLVHNGEYCTCGKKGCWEAYASVTALIRQTEAAIKANPDSLMRKKAEENGSVSGRTAFEAAKEGDAAAQQVVDTYLEYVADGISSVINIFQPNVLVIGGGISREGDYMLKPIQQYIDKYTYCKDIPQTQLKIATLFNDAGIIGAALASAM